ncbi:SDR family oxidoreductase [Nocardioides panacisoli]|uniref:SDR family NAD(P)-dependent oxidoreductase n=1 Tax=Nocardioides panacisoli TaxID=627624 RepID=A0ABP7IUE7_9ACTN
MDDGSIFLVTGASTGIGCAAAEHLAGRGHRVLAGVRSDAAAAELGRTDRIRPVLLDVRESGSVKAAAEMIADAVGSHGLDGLVNNAGIQVAGPLEHLPLDAVRDVLETNVLGQVAVTQAVLPLLRSAPGGRVVLISSMSGRVALPFLGPYAASKHALEAIGDSWRRELAPSGIRVSVVEPGNTATPMWDKALGTEGLSRFGLEAEQRYGAMEAWVRAQAQRSADAAIPTDCVVRAIEHALTARRPRQRYVVGIDAHVGTRLARHAPRLLDRAIAVAMARDARRRTGGS